MNSGWVAFDAISLTRVADSQVSYLAYDAENRLKSVSGEVNASYAYDGDGRRVKMVVGGVTGLLWLVGDHLGSGTVSMDAATGVKTYERYKPWGDTRGTTTLPTRYQFTGQRREASLNGLYDYGARWYDSLAGVFLQPDSLVPDPYNPIDYGRYSYTRNNLINMVDPSGHSPCDGVNGGDPDCEGITIQRRLVLKPKQKPGYKCGPDGLQCLGNPQDRRIAIDGGWSLPKLPSAETIGSLGYEWAHTASVNIDWYEKNRTDLFILYGWSYITKDGMIKDDVFIAMLIFMEFGSAKGRMSSIV